MSPAADPSDQRVGMYVGGPGVGNLLDDDFGGMSEPSITATPSIEIPQEVMESRGEIANYIGGCCGLQDAIVSKLQEDFDPDTEATDASVGQAVQVFPEDIAVGSDVLVGPEAPTASGLTAASVTVASSPTPSSHVWSSYAWAPVGTGTSIAPDTSAPPYPIEFLLSIRWGGWKNGDYGRIGEWNTPPFTPPTRTPDVQLPDDLKGKYATAEGRVECAKKWDLYDTKVTPLETTKSLGIAFNWYKATVLKITIATMVARKLSSIEMIVCPLEKFEKYKAKSIVVQSFKSQCGDGSYCFLQKEWTGDNEWWVFKGIVWADCNALNAMIANRTFSNMKLIDKATLSSTAFVNLLRYNTNPTVMTQIGNALAGKLPGLTAPEKVALAGVAARGAKATEETSAGASNVSNERHRSGRGEPPK